MRDVQSREMPREGLDAWKPSEHCTQDQGPGTADPEIRGFMLPDAALHRSSPEY